MDVRPEGLTAPTLQVCILQHLTLNVMGGVENHQVQVDLVAPVPVLPPQGVGPGVLHLSLEDLEDGRGPSLVLLALHLELLVAHNLPPVLPPAEGRRRLEIFQSENIYFQ